MKRLLILLALLVATFVSGCGPGMVHSASERKRRHRNIAELEARQINDDWDAFWMVDRPSRLTYWHLREAD